MGTEWRREATILSARQRDNSGSRAGSGKADWAQCLQDVLGNYKKQFGGGVTPIFESLERGSAGVMTWARNRTSVLCSMAM